MPYKTIIIDDEFPARQRLNELLGKYPETFDIIAEAENGKAALQKIEKLNPDLIFLDIQMPGMTGFQMLNQLSSIPLIVFCTAYDQYSLEAFETNCIDYLLKPVKVERIEQTIDKLKHFEQQFQPEKILSFLKQLSEKSPRKEMSSITIKKGDRIIFIKLEDVCYFKAGDKYVSLYTVKGDEHISDISLQQLLEQLPGNFKRIQRSIIINSDYIKEAQKYFNSRYTFVMEDYPASRLISGRSYLSEIKQWMGFL